MRLGAIRGLHSTEQQTSYETCLQLFLDIVINFLLAFSWISFLPSYTNSSSHSFSGCTLKTRTLSIENAKLSEMDDGSPRTALPFCHYLFLLLFPWTRNNLSFNFLDLTFIFFYSFHYDFCYLCYLQAMRVEPKKRRNENPDRWKNPTQWWWWWEWEWTNERDQIETNPGYGRRRSPYLHACQPCLALLCISLVFTGDLIYLRCFCSLLLASLPCNVDTLLAWEEKGTPISFFFNNAKWKSWASFLHCSSWPYYWSSTLFSFPRFCPPRSRFCDEVTLCLTDSVAVEHPLDLSRPPTIRLFKKTMAAATR